MRTHRDGNIRYDEYDNDNLFPLSEYKSSDPQRGMCSLPRHGLNLAECEIARAFKVAASSIETIAFIVPRKVCSRAPTPLSHVLTVLLQSDVFQFDISPLRRLLSLLCLQPNTSAGRRQRRSSTRSRTAPSPLALSVSLPPTAAPAPAKTTSSPPPAAAPASAMVAQETSPAPTPTPAPALAPVRQMS